VLFPRPAQAVPSLSNKNMLQHIFPFESEASELQKDSNSSSHCSSVEEKLERYGCHALNESEHLGLIIGNETLGSELIQHFGLVSALSRASLQQIRAFLPRTKAIRLMVACEFPPTDKL
jgi:hypothetical protein